MKGRNKARQEYAQHTMLDFDTIKDYQLEMEIARKVMNYTLDHHTIENDELRYR